MSTDPWAPINAAFGPDVVADWRAAAAAAADAPLAADEADIPLSGEDLDAHLVFGFIQRVLVRLNNAGKRQGLLFPKQDPDENRWFDYFDGEGRIYVLTTREVPLEPGWLRPRPEQYPGMVIFDVQPGAAEAILLAFMGAVAALRDRAG